MCMCVHLHSTQGTCHHSVLCAYEFCTFQTSHTRLDIIRWLADLAALPFPPSSNLERRGRWLICFFADPKTHATCCHTDTHTITYLTLWSTRWSPFLDLAHCGCSSWDAWHVLPPLDMRYHKYHPQLLKESAPPVQLWYVPLRKDLHPNDKCIVGWYINHVVKDDQWPLRPCAISSTTLVPWFFSEAPPTGFPV